MAWQEGGEERREGPGSVRAQGWLACVGTHSLKLLTQQQHGEVEQRSLAGIEMGLSCGVKGHGTVTVASAPGQLVSPNSSSSVPCS